MDFEGMHNIKFGVLSLLPMALNNNLLFIGSDFLPRKHIEIYSTADEGETAPVSAK